MTGADAQDVFRFIMELWLLPIVGDRRGFLGSAWDPSNTPSDKWHNRNGFRPKGFHVEKGKPKETGYIAAVWQGFEGERAIDKVDTIFKDLPDFTS